MRLDITLIGDIALAGEGDEPRRTIPGANARVALALLALERGQGVTSERLAEALWPDGLPATWGLALRMTMSRVRSFIKDALDPTAPDPIVAQEGGTPGTSPTGCCSMSTSRMPSRPWPPLVRRWRPVTSARTRMRRTPRAGCGARSWPGATASGSTSSAIACPTSWWRR